MPSILFFAIGGITKSNCFKRIVFATFIFEIYRNLKDDGGAVKT
jgi:hypothetical protein